MSESHRLKTFQDLILGLQQFWAERGCVLLQPYDMPMGAGTFHPATFLRAIGPEPWNAAYVQPSRRPTDGRYGDNPNRLQHYYQFQVVLKPSPKNIQDVYLESLQSLGIDPLTHDIRFVEDNWESPTLGAWGLGWEVWLDGMEITQFTYFQQLGGLECRPVTGELTYGLERLAMYLQGVENVFDLVWTNGPLGDVTYRQVFHQNEVEMSKYNFEQADVETCFKWFDWSESECKRLLDEGLALPALLGPLLVLGIASVLYWMHTESLGRGDLRFYALIQFLPILFIPIIFFLFPARFNHSRYFLNILGWYLLAKVFEHFDADVFDITAQTLSGHSIKHLLAGVAIFYLVRYMEERRPLAVPIP